MYCPSLSSAPTNPNSHAPTPPPVPSKYCMTILHDMCMCMNRYGTVPYCIACSHIAGEDQSISMSLRWSRSQSLVGRPFAHAACCAVDAAAAARSSTCTNYCIARASSLHRTFLLVFAILLRSQSLCFALLQLVLVASLAFQLRGTARHGTARFLLLHTHSQ